ncbi:uncharacterized protein [Battus philenor]|uniref:uncharacterized protein n=1 Tax=Battus philenor TaxID=42288 RepID=UPI0035CF110A
MFIVKNSLLALCVSVSLAGINFQRSGWLDRVVQYHKNNFFADLKKLPSIHVKASIEPAPYGYVDPPSWDFDSVMRLLGILQQSDAAVPVFRHLRRTMSYRRFMKYADTFKAFPSIGAKYPNNLYYDVDSAEFNVEEATGASDVISDDSIIIVSNPTEARLPAAQISIKLLREILEARAIAARYLPTTRSTVFWKPMNKTTKPTPDGATTAAGGSDGGSNVTSPDGGNQTGGTAATGLTT